jgi:hypothetical protein
MNPTLVKGTAAVGAVAALVFGAAAISGAKSPSSSSSSSSAAPFGGRQRPVPAGGFQDVTGTVAAKVKAAALAEVKGTIEHIMQLPDGTYVAHVIRPSGSEVHVHVSEDFEVLGTDTGPGRGRGMMPPGAGAGTPPQGAAPPQNGFTPPQSGAVAPSGTTKT